MKELKILEIYKCSGKNMVFLETVMKSRKLKIYKSGSVNFKINKKSYYCLLVWNDGDYTIDVFDINDIRTEVEEGLSIINYDRILKIKKLL